MGTILVNSLPGRRCYVSHAFSSDSDGKTCRKLAALFLCAFGLTACFCTKPEAFWLRVVILALTGTSAFLFLAPLHEIKTTLTRIRFGYGSSEKSALPVTSCIEKGKKPLTIAVPTTIESKQSKIEYPRDSPLGSAIRSSLPSYENISVVS